MKYLKLTIILYIIYNALTFTYKVQEIIYSYKTETNISEIIQETKLASKSNYKLDVVRKIAETFPENKTVMVAIAIEESNLNPNAVGYNCFYKLGGETYDRLIKRNIDLNTVSKTRLPNYVSTFCRTGHEKYAWSKDGGLMGINGAEPHEMNIDNNLLKAKSIYEKQGLLAWTSYKSGRYKDNLIEAENLLNLI